MNTAEVARRCGVTYRQVDYWVRQGRVAGQAPDSGTGSGGRREWTEAGVRCVAAFARWAALTGNAAPPDPVRLRVLAETTGEGWALLTPRGWRFRHYAHAVGPLDSMGLEIGPATVLISLAAPPSEVSR